MLHGRGLFRLHWELFCCAADVGALWGKEAGKVVACGKEVGTAALWNTAGLGPTSGDKAAWGAPCWKKVCLGAPCGSPTGRVALCGELAGMGASCGKRCFKRESKYILLVPFQHEGL